MGNVGDVFPVANESIFNVFIVRVTQAHASNEDLIVWDAKVLENWILKLYPSGLRTGM